ncbi:UD11 glucuronosyltransferase, partial [Piaya cayana]|nr:UD11 glucuronosyltransferase [Piaya cayana]
VPADGSHWLSMHEVLNGLRQKGHEIVVVAPEINVHIKPLKNFIMKMYPVSFTQEELNNHYKRSTDIMFEGGSFLERFLKTYQGMKNVSAIFLATCTNLLYNKELVRYLEESKF